MIVNVNICDIKCTNFFARLSDNTRICRDQCITFVKKMNGLYKCMNLTCDPSDSTYLNLCFSSCPLNSKNLAGICIPNCPSNTPLLQIPSSSLILDLTLNNQIQLYYAIYTFLNSISDSSKLTCVSACTTPKIIYHSTCIDICPSGRFVDEKGNCIENCNKFINTIGLIKYCVTICPKFINVDNVNCVNTCPSNLFASGNNCVYQCPNYSNNNVCVTICPSNTVLDISTKNCLNDCPTPNYNKISGKCYQPCNSNSYFDITNLICIPCGQSCATCITSPNNCITCASSYLKLIDKPQCLSSCIPGYYVSGNTCNTCPSTCIECMSINQCSSCIPGYSLVIMLGSTTCQSVCPAAQYSDGTVCKNCPNNCSTCDSTGCLKCQSTFFILNGMCIKTCSSGYYSGKNENSLGESVDQCIKCDSKCLECSGSSTNCLSCLSIKYFYMNNCYDQCPVGFYNDDTTKTCKNCDETCRTCDGPSYNNCLTCSKDLTYKSAECVTNCLSSQIYTTSKNCIESKTCYSGLSLLVNEKFNPNDGNMTALANYKIDPSCQAFNSTIRTNTRLIWDNTYNGTLSNSNTTLIIEPIKQNITGLIPFSVSLFYNNLLILNTIKSSDIQFFKVLFLLNY